MQIPKLNFSNFLFLLSDGEKHMKMYTARLEAKSNRKGGYTVSSYGMRDVFVHKVDASQVTAENFVIEIYKEAGIEYQDIVFSFNDRIAHTIVTKGRQKILVFQNRERLRRN